MRLIWITVVLALAACGGGSEDSTAFCDSVEAFPDAIAEGRNAPEDMADLEATIQLLENVEADVRANAPGSIKDDVGVIFDTGSDSVRVSEQERLTEAREKVNDYIREECDLTITL